MFVPTVVFGGVIGCKMFLMCLVKINPLPYRIVVVIFLPKVEDFCAEFVAWKGEKKALFEGVVVLFEGTVVGSQVAGCGRAGCDKTSAVYVLE